MRDANVTVSDLNLRCGHIWLSSKSIVWCLSLQAWKLGYLFIERISKKMTPLMWKRPTKGESLVFIKTFCSLEILWMFILLNIWEYSNFKNNPFYSNPTIINILGFSLFLSAYIVKFYYSAWKYLYIFWFNIYTKIIL